MDYIYNFKDHCLTCEHYNPTKNWAEINASKGFWCSKHGWQDPYDKCSNYRDGGYSNSYLEDCMKEYNKKKRYYIVTTVCNMLNLPEDNEYRSMFARVIEDNLIGTIDGEQLLSDYDVYGYELAIIMENNKHNPEIIKLVKETLVPEFNKMLKDVNANNINRAVLRYIVLVRRLMQKFEIPYAPVESQYIEGLTDYSQVHDIYNKTK